MPKQRIQFDTPDPYIEWHVIDIATRRSLARCDEPDHALTHRAVADGTAFVVEATVRASIIRYRTVTEDTIGEEA